MSGEAQAYPGNSKSRVGGQACRKAARTLVANVGGERIPQWRRAASSLKVGAEEHGVSVLMQDTTRPYLTERRSSATSGQAWSERQDGRRRVEVSGKHSKWARLHGRQSTRAAMSKAWAAPPGGGNNPRDRLRDALRKGLERGAATPEAAVLAAKAARILEDAGIAAAGIGGREAAEALAELAIGRARAGEHEERADGRAQVLSSSPPALVPIPWNGERLR